MTWRIWILPESLPWIIQSESFRWQKMKFIVKYFHSRYVSVVQKRKQKNIIFHFIFHSNIKLNESFRTAKWDANFIWIKLKEIYFSIWVGIFARKLFLIFIIIIIYTHIEVGCEISQTLWNLARSIFSENVG